MRLCASQAETKTCKAAPPELPFLEKKVVAVQDHQPKSSLPPKQEGELEQRARMFMRRRWSRGGREFARLVFRVSEAPGPRQEDMEPLESLGFVGSVNRSVCHIFLSLSSGLLLFFNFFSHFQLASSSFSHTPLSNCLVFSTGLRLSLSLCQRLALVSGISNLFDWFAPFLKLLSLSHSFTSLSLIRALCVFLSSPFLPGLLSFLKFSSLPNSRKFSTSRSFSSGLFQPSIFKNPCGKLLGENVNPSPGNPERIRPLYWL